MPQSVYVFFLVLRLHFGAPDHVITQPEMRPAVGVYKCDDAGMAPPDPSILGDRLAINKQGEVYDCERAWYYEPR